MSDLISSGALLLALLNPFLVIVYLVDLVQKLPMKQFRRVLLRAGLIATGVFCFFALLGDTVFSNFIQAEFASFQIFGGIIFLLVGVQFVFKGPAAIEFLRGEAEHLAGAIAMPILIGPGTISASVIIGNKHLGWIACLVIASAVMTSVVIIILLKALHDYLQPRLEKITQRYIEITGRIMALYVGTVAVEMIMQGLRTWIQKF